MRSDSYFLFCKSQTRSPSKAAGMFSGTQDKCATCGKTAYPLEKVCLSINITYKWQHLDLEIYPKVE